MSTTYHVQVIFDPFGGRECLLILSDGDVLHDRSHHLQCPTWAARSRATEWLASVGFTHGDWKRDPGGGFITATAYPTDDGRTKG